MLRVESHGAGRIDIGSNVYIGDDTLISAASAVTIGSWTLVAHGVHVFDNDSHPIAASDRREDWKGIRGLPAKSTTVRSAAVTIGSDVWIGFHAIVLKGVSIGDRAIVAAGSVVTRDVPEDCVVAGNPAQVLRPRA